MQRVANRTVIGEARPLYDICALWKTSIKSWTPRCPRDINACNGPDQNRDGTPAAGNKT